MNQDDQRFVLMAAAAQAHYAKQQARREARKAALLSQVSALSNSSQPMDPKLQAELERLIRAEAQRTEHQRAQWGADVRQGVPDADTVHTEESDLPEGLSRERMGPLDKNTGRGDE